MVAKVCECLRRFGVRDGAKERKELRVVCVLGVFGARVTHDVK